MGAESIDKDRLLHAVTVANIREFIDSLPLGYNTKIGMEGNGVSQGQRQRILIARAVYKDPEFIFLDEATNALDANNEKEIMEHLHRFYRGRTVVVVAHRLSTVRDADNIVVLDKGRVAEEGTHEELTPHRNAWRTRDSDTRAALDGRNPYQPGAPVTPDVLAKAENSYRRWLASNGEVHTK